MTKNSSLSSPASTQSTSFFLSLLNGNSLEELQKLPEASIDSVVTDPPYGLSKEPDIAKVMRHWSNGDTYTHTSKHGFMGKSWDSFVPGPEYWKEVFRVLKPGGHLLAMCSTRTWDLLSVAIRFAGFENRDTISIHGTPMLSWNYGQGFPKSLSVNRAIDKTLGAERPVVGTWKPGGTARIMGGQGGATSGRAEEMYATHELRNELPITADASDEAKQWHGWGTALKPSWEVILVFRKPLEEHTVAAQVLKTNTGAINIDGCRITSSGPSPTSKKRELAEKTGKSPGRPGEYGRTIVSRVTHERYIESRAGEQLGRWPSNTLLCHMPECQIVGTCSVKTGTHIGENRNPEETKNQIYGAYKKETKNGGYTTNPENGTETIDRWECVEDCPVLEMNTQSGERKSGSTPWIKGISKGHQGRVYGKESRLPGTVGPSYADTGGASRFFSQFTWEPEEAKHAFLYLSKAARSERDEGLSTEESNESPSSSQAVEFGQKTVVKNTHPTVKPISLMRWLCKLVTPPGGTVLDPFMGSGTTGIAAQKEGFGFVGIELNPEFFEIAKERINFHHLERSTVSPAEIVDNDHDGGDGSNGTNIL